MYHIKHQVLCVSISYKIAPLIITCGLQRQHRLLHVPFDKLTLFGVLSLGAKTCPTDNFSAVELVDFGYKRISRNSFYKKEFL